MDQRERLNNVDRHVHILQRLLELSAPEGASQRLYRLRTFIKDEYMVISLVQNLDNRYSQRGIDVKIRLYVSHACETTNTTLSGQYAIEEIVAFLALDTVDPASVHWADETNYNPIIIADGILPKLNG